MFVFQNYSLCTLEIFGSLRELLCYPTLSTVNKSLKYADSNLQFQFVASKDFSHIPIGPTYSQLFNVAHQMIAES